MSKFLRIGVHQSNISGYTSKAWCVRQVGSAYDLDGNVAQITYPSGRIVSYIRGSTGLVASISTQVNGSSASVTLASGVSYQPFGPLQTLTYGNGLILWKTFTQDYNLNTLIVEQGSNSVVNRTCRERLPAVCRE